MRRHLLAHEAAGALRRGKQIEQLLESAPVAGRGTIRWLVLYGSDGRFVLFEHHVLEEHAEVAGDIAVLPAVDPEEEHGEGRRLAVLDTPEAALDRAAAEHGADPARWVNFPLVNDEYRDRKA